MRRFTTFIATGRAVGLAVVLGLTGCATEPERPAPPSRPYGMTGGNAPGYPAPLPFSPPPDLDRGLSAAPFGSLPAPAIRAESALMMDVRSGRIIFQKNADLPRPVASTQKLMTALVLSQSGRTTGPVTVTLADAQVEPTRVGLRAGDVYDRKELLAAMLIKSCNDAAACLARDNAGSIPAFADRMNAMATRIGMRNSHFVNPHGLPASNQWSTARDMARLAYFCYRDPLIRSLVRNKLYNFRMANGRMNLLESTNRLFDLLVYCNGMKTGYTNASGKCFISSSSARGHDFILAQFGGKSDSIFADANAMHLWAMREHGGQDSGPTGFTQ